MLLSVGNVRALRFDDGTHAARWRDGSPCPARVLPRVAVAERFSEAAGTTRLESDLEVACPAEVDGAPVVLLQCPA